MPEDISVQILTQASDNIQKLFDLSTRIDERVKSVQTNQDNLSHRLDEVVQHSMLAAQKIAVLESKETEDHVDDEVTLCQKAITEMDKRLYMLESKSSIHTEKWNKIANFVVHLIWVVLAAYVLTKLNLQSPNIP